MASCRGDEPLNAMEPVREGGFAACHASPQTATGRLRSQSSIDYFGPTFDD